MTAKPNSPRHQLRQHIRHARQRLSACEQQHAAAQIATGLLATAEIQQARRIAIYLTNDAEIDTSLLIQALWLAGKDLCLPVLHLFTPGHLLFQRFTSDTPLRPNSFGIDEPVPALPELVLLSQLDVVLLPLVAFDAQGHRLGMGGGFYDRTLANVHSLPRPPHLIGLAHDCQLVDAVPVEAWDVPLPMIATPSHIWRF